MKEHEVQGLIELRDTFSARLAKMEDYQALQKEFERQAQSLLRKAVQDAKIDPQSPQAISRLKVVSNGCGFCEVCITACTGCVFHVGGVGPTYWE